jgi:hypothetical protein
LLIEEPEEIEEPVPEDEEAEGDVSEGSQTASEEAVGDSEE